MFFWKKQKIVFMYADRYRYSGSTVMRGEQLLTIVKKYHGDRMKFQYRSLSTDFKNCVIFLTKGAVTDITSGQISELVGRGNRVLLDPVDNPLDETKAQLATGVVAASLEAFDDYHQRGYPTYLVNHHVDIRLPRNIPDQSPSLRCGYFGEMINTIETKKIAKQVDFVQVDTGKQSTEWLSKPREYNLHYAVRANNVEGFKPFLKGFTAAACNANIIIQKDQQEAVRWLGADYPYLVEPNPTEAAILSMLNHIRKTFGDAEWKRGLEKMAELRKRTADDAIAAEFAAMVDTVVFLRVD